MNYKKVYDNLINYRRTNKLRKTKKQYTELHHVIPKSLGGSDSKKNLVRLTAREHFIAHALLVRYYKNVCYKSYKSYESMLVAFNNMNSSPIGEEFRYFNSRLFEKYREEFSRIQSKRQTGEGNSQFGTMWITSELLEENKKINSNEEIPEGWKKGRVNYKKLNENIKKYHELYNEYNNLGIEWKEFKEKFSLKGTISNFKSQCKKYLNIEFNKIYKLENKQFYTEEDYNKEYLKLVNYYTEIYRHYNNLTYKELCIKFDLKVSHRLLSRKLEKYVTGYNNKTGRNKLH